MDSARWVEISEAYVDLPILNISELQNLSQVKFSL